MKFGTSRWWMLTLILFCNFCIAEPLDQPKTGVSDVVATISKKLFSGCDIILAVNQVRWKSRATVIEDNIEGKLANLGQQLYSLRMDGLIFDNRSKTIKSGEGYYFNRFASLSKYRNNCALVIIILDTIETKLPQILFDLITPKRLEISKKDEDHYIFIAPREVGEELMFSREFGSKIKYKLLIPLPDNTPVDYKHEVLTMCFFCNGGRPAVVALDFDLDAFTNKENGLHSYRTISVHDLFPDFVKDFNGSDIIAAVSTRTTQRTEMYVDENGHYQRKRGLYFMVLDVLQERLGFHLKIIPSYGDGGTGLRLKNGTWFGSVGNVLQETAHIGMVCAQTYQRNQVVGFAFSLQYEWITFTTGRPKPIHSWRTMFKPFTAEMWAAVVTSTVGVIGTFVVMRNRLSRGWKLGEMLQYIIGSALEQSYKSPKDPAVLVLCAFWLSFGVVVSTAYRSKLFTFLVFPEVTVAPTTFSALANSKDFAWGLMYLKGAMYAVFKSSTEDTYVKIFQNWVLVNNSYECFHRTTQENFACIAWQSMAEHNAHKNFTDKSGNKFLVEAPSGTFFIPCGFVLEKRAIFKRNFDKILHWSHDTGLVGKWEEMDWAYVRKMRFDWERETVSKEGAALEQGGPQPLENFNLMGAYSVLLVLSGGAVLVYGMELAQFASRKKKKKKEIYG